MPSLSMHALQLFTYFGVNYCGCVAHAALDPLTVEVQRYTSTHMRKNLKNFSSWLRRSTRIATGNSFLAHTHICSNHLTLSYEPKQFRHLPLPHLHTAYTRKQGLTVHVTPFVARHHTIDVQHGDNLRHASVAWSTGRLW